jgi:hypothetical protein
MQNHDKITKQFYKTTKKACAFNLILGGNFNKCKPNKWEGLHQSYLCDEITFTFLQYIKENKASQTHLPCQ